MEGVDLFGEAFAKFFEGASSIKTYSGEEFRFEKEAFVNKFERGLVETNLGDDEEEKDDEKKPVLSCSACKIDFNLAAEQRSHYKLDWHRYNLKQKLKGKSNISEENYNEQIDDLSSTSGESSSSEDEEETLNSVATAQGKIFLQKEDGTVFSMYKCLLATKKEEISNDELNTKLSDLLTNKQWTIFMLGGGHFAGAVFNKGEPILHKTFHCYTVRAGQGGSQSSKDNKNATNQPKSAGASLRRYNENALIQHVHEIVENWKEQIAKSHLILYRASGPYNRSVLFGATKNPLLNKLDKRLRTIPFSTKKATFTEVKRVFKQLSTVNCYKNVEEANNKVLIVKNNQQRQRSPIKEAQKNPKTRINRAKSREDKNREIPGEEINSLQKMTESGESTPPIEFEFNETEISFSHLQEFEDTFNKNKQKNKPKKKSKTAKLREENQARLNLISQAVISSNIDDLNKLILNKDEFDLILIDDDQNTLLHFACLQESLEVVKFLLYEKSVDLCKKNKRLQTAYACTQNKEIREVFKEFAVKNPNKFNYNKAHIPIVLPLSEEALEKKRLQRKAKRDKEKIKKKENAIKKQEEQNEERFANLTDREKCALAAERRILGLGGKIILRCFNCGKDMSGLVPFTYNEYKFCTVDCLKSHRMKNITI